MAIYLLAYDLVNESKGTFDYQPLWDELKRLDAFRTQYSLWLINANNTAQQLVEHFKSFVDKTIACGSRRYGRASTGI